MVDATSILNARPASAGSDRTDEASPRILVVDDEPAILTALAIRLDAAGFAVDAVADATEALVRAAADPPDVALLDRRLPDFSGDVLATRLRREVGPANLPVIILTANASGLDPVVEIGPPLVVVHKPYRAEDLIPRIRHQLSLARPLAQPGPAPGSTTREQPVASTTRAFAGSRPADSTAQAASDAARSGPYPSFQSHSERPS
ncbi:MAG: response regulator transcription factor [Phycisphaerales bacterium]